MCSASITSGIPNTVNARLVHPLALPAKSQCVAIGSGRRSQSTTPTTIGSRIMTAASSMPFQFFFIASRIFLLPLQVADEQHDFLEHRGVHFIIDKLALPLVADEVGVL